MTFEANSESEKDILYKLNIPPAKRKLIRKKLNEIWLYNFDNKRDITS
jgi:hypothetical protein